MTKEVKCPSCNAIVAWSNKFPFKPFCSERCKLIDLGDWASENNKINGEKLDPEAVSYLNRADLDS